MMPFIPLFLIGVILLLTGCGTRVPGVEEVWEPVAVNQDLTDKIRTKVFCETVNAIRSVRQITYHFESREQRKKVRVLPGNYGVQIQTTLTIDENTAFNPSIGFLDTLSNAKDSGVNVPRSIAGNLTGTISSTATRVDTAYSYYSIKHLVPMPDEDKEDAAKAKAAKIASAKARAAKAKATRITAAWQDGADVRAVRVAAEKEEKDAVDEAAKKADKEETKQIEAAEEAAIKNRDKIKKLCDRPLDGSSLLLTTELKIEDFLFKTLLTTSDFPSSPPTKGGQGKTAKFDVFSHQIKFIVVTNGGVNPVIKLANIATGFGSQPMISMGRTRTHDLTLTFGPGEDQPILAALQVHRGPPQGNETK